ncbi:MAG: methyltransferase domain-containing protein [Burkholderiaceae bacterium]|nr:methyltransferase domain-containing protein [Burkholderiaceae bacterium]
MSQVMVSEPAVARQRDDISCPRCLGRLSVSTSSSACVGCGAEYRVDDSIIDLRTHRNDYYFNPVPRDEMRLLTSSGHTRPWFLTIRRFLESVRQNPDWLDNLVADGRYAWQLFLKLRPDSRVLDLGCGLGNLTKNVAPNVAHVYALDLTYERLQFARLRFDKAAISERVTLLAGGDSGHLPFPDQSLDCVTLSGVLEWVADDENVWRHDGSRLAKGIAGVKSFFGKSNPRRTQLRFLEEIRRVLKPEGQLFIAIENRLSYAYFGKRPDHHSGLWYGSLLPRFVANVYSILARRQPYRTYTYSFRGYARLLKEAGFPVQEFIGLDPGYSHLAELIPLRTSGGVWKAERPSGRDKIRRNRNFVPAFGIICSQKQSDRESLAEQLAREISRTLEQDDRYSVLSSFHVTGKHKGIIRGSSGSDAFVVKMPFTEAMRAGCEANFAFLEAAKWAPQLSRLTAEPLMKGELDRLSYYVERQLRGRPLRGALTAANSAHFFDAISTVLKAVNPRPEKREVVSVGGELFRLQVSRPLEEVRQTLEGAPLADRIQRYLEAHLDGLPIVVGVAHGDFSVSNVLVEGSEVTGIVDWDGVDHGGLPVLDGLSYVDSVRRHLDPGRTAASNVTRLADWAQLDESERAFLTSCYERSEVPVRLHAALVCLYWLRHVAQQLPHGLQYDRPAIGRRIEDVFESLIQ